MTTLYAALADALAAVGVARAALSRGADPAPAAATLRRALLAIAAGLEDMPHERRPAPRGAERLWWER